MAKFNREKAVAEARNYIESAVRYVTAMTIPELEEMGHDGLNGIPQMMAALRTLDELAQYAPDKAIALFWDFMEVNLPGVSFVND